MYSDHQRRLGEKTSSFNELTIKSPQTTSDSSIQYLLNRHTTLTIQRSNRLVGSLLGTSEQTSSSGSNKTSLLTGHGTSGNGRGLTNVLVVTTTVGVVHGVHGNTSSLGPRVSLDLVLVVSTTGLKQGLVDSTTTGNDTNDTSGVRGDNLLGTRRQLDSGLALIGVVANDDNVVTGGTGEAASVTRGVLNRRHNGTFGARTQGQDVTDVQRSLLTSVDELTSVHTLSGDHELLSQLVLVSVTEHNLGQGSTSTRVVHDGADNTSLVTVLLGVRVLGKLGGTLSKSGHRSEDGPSTFLAIVSNLKNFSWSMPTLLRERGRQRGGHGGDGHR